MRVAFNGENQAIASIEELSFALDRFDCESSFELCISASDAGPFLTMLRSADHAWLMYMRFSGDDGFVTMGNQENQGVCKYRLSNGQIDEYPLSWCIDLEQCYMAIAHFFVNDGARYDFVDWRVG